MKIKIKNFQSLADVEVEVKGLTVLIGGSNLGKSAFIRALEGALFNKPGDAFVRRGADHTVVSIEGLPTVKGQFHNIVWKKGSAGTNVFTIDGQEYAKVGLSTPQHLLEWGYKEVQIDKEYIRPQVSTQFEGFFLLSRSGSFISDVLTVASRLAVLLGATEFCSSDLRKVKQLVNVRYGDLDAAKKKLLNQRPIIELSERVNSLQPRIDDARAKLQGVSVRKTLIESLRILEPLTKLQLPTPTEIHPALGQQVLVIRDYVRELASQIVLPELPLITKNYEELISKIEYWQSKAAQLSNLSIRLKQYETQVLQREAALASVEQDLEQTESELSLLRSEMQICPVCDRPMEMSGVQS